jgi:hypothetical protein
MMGSICKHGITQADCDSCNTQNSWATHDELIEDIQEQLSDLCDSKPGEIICLVKPEEVTDEEFDSAVTELGLEKP